MSNVITVSPSLPYALGSAPSLINPPVGSIGYDNIRKRFQIFHGSGWTPIEFTDSQISFDVDHQEVIDWAKKRMEEERELDELCKQHPGLEDARRQYEMMKALVREHHYE